MSTRDDLFTKARSILANGHVVTDIIDALQIECDRQDDELRQAKDDKAEAEGKVERLRAELDEIELKAVAAANSRDPRLHGPALRKIADIARQALGGAS